MIIIINDYDEMFKENPLYPYSQDYKGSFSQESIKDMAESIQKLHRGKALCKCDRCGLKFISNKPIVYCPFREQHKEEYDLDKTARRMLID